MDAAPTQTFVTRLTAEGRGAIATIAIWGPDATKHVDNFFRSAAGRPLNAFVIDRIVYGRWDRGGEATEDVVLVRRSEQEIEVSCHGGTAASTAIIESLVYAGAVESRAERWLGGHTPGKIESDAWLELSNAKTDRTAAILLDQLRGALRRAIEQVIVDLRSNDVAAAQSRLRQLAARASLGLRLTAPWQVAIIGEPNVGKSSLINRLAGYDRAIVLDEPGTTRDVLAASTVLNGWPVDLLDTAGLRESSDEIEIEGVRRANRAASSADLAVIVFDAQKGSDQLASTSLFTHAAYVAVGNKRDLAPHTMFPEHVVLTSALTGDGIDQLIGTIVSRLAPKPPLPGEPVPFTQQQVDQIQAAQEALAHGQAVAAAAILDTLLTPSVLAMQ